MYVAVPMHLAECDHQANGDVQKRSQIEWLTLLLFENQIQRFTARIVQYQNRPSFVTSELERLGSPCGIEFGCERVFVLEPSKTLRRRLFCGEGECQNR
jgi:hypothetical protein